MKRSQKLLKIFTVSFLVLVLCPSVALALKVQKGTTTISSGLTSTTVTLSSAVSSLDNAFLLMWSTGDNGTDYAEAWQATGYLSATNQITFQREGTRDDCQIGYYVIEAEYGEFQVVDRGSLTIAAASTTQDTNISQAITQSRSFIVAHSMIGDAANNDDNEHKGAATVHFVDNDTIRATRNVSGTHSCDVYYEVVEWSVASGVSVQTGEYNGAIGATEVTDSITTAVTPGQTWLYCTFAHSSDGLSQAAVNAYLKDGSTVGMSRYDATFTSRVRWWVIEFPADVVVQRDATLTSNKANLTETITFPTPFKIANSWSDVYNDSDGTGDAKPRQAWYTQVTSTTQVTNTRYYSGQLANLSTQVIDTSGWVELPTPTANAVTTNTVAAGETDILVLDVSLSNPNAGDLVVSDVIVENVGTATDAEINSVKLYYDSNNSGDYTTGVDQLAGSGTFSSGSKTFSGLSISIPGTGSEDLYVILDLVDAVTDANTLDVKIPINGITYTVGKSNPDSDLNSTGTREIDLVLDHFIVAHDNAASAGIAENITITARDDKNNTKIDYTGQITLDTNGTDTTITWANVDGGGTFNDGGASVDTASYTFVTGDNGAVTLSINDTKSETINISVTGDTKSDENTEGDLVVSPGALDHFVIVHDNNAIAGVADNVEVRVKDANENTLTDYTGTITLDTDGTATTISWTKLTGAGVFNDDGASVDTATYTYDASDNGVATFTITDTTTDSLDISVTGGGQADDNSHSALVVAPDVIDYFKIAHDNNAIASIAENVTITAYDQYDNIKTDYTGEITTDTNGTATTITWALDTGNGVFLDGGGSADTATYTYDNLDNGVVIFTISDTKTETINISVTGDAKTDDNTEGDLVVAAGAIDYFKITHDGSAVTDIADNVTITAYDASNNIKDDYTGEITVDTNGSGDISWANSTGGGIFNDGGASDDTATYTFVAGDNGVVSLTITNDTAEAVNISATGDTKTDDDTEGNLTFISSGIDHFLIAHDGEGISGSDETVTITAKDGNNDTLTTYQGSITIDTNGTANSITWAKTTGNGTFNDGGAGVDTATYTYDATDNGVVVLTINDTTEETINISVTAGSKTDDDTEGNLVINPTGLHHFSVQHDNTANAGVAESITIQVHDANENIVTNYTGQITMDTDGTATAITWAKQTGNGSFADGGASVDTATYTYVASDNGQCVLTISDTKVEIINISATGEGKPDCDTEGLLTIGPGAIDYFKITHDSSAVAGISDNVAIAAYDAYDNAKTDYTGQITLDTNGTPTTITWANVDGGGSFADGGASVDTATYTYVSGDNGSVTLSISDTVTEVINISVTGDTKSDDNSEGDLTISPTAINYFKITHDNSATAGVAENVTVTAYDTYDNIKTNYTGQITADTDGTATTITWALGAGNGVFNDGGASVDTATYTYDSADNGAVTLTINDTTKETVNIAVSGDAKTDDDTEGNLVVGSGSIGYFIINHDSTAVAGVADNVTITAYDAYDNLKDDYTGQITVGTDGTDTTITWANVNGLGSFVDGGASVDTATYTYVSGDNGAVTLSITDTVAETLDIDAADGSYTDDETEGALVFSATSIDHFVVGHDGTAIVDAFEPVTVTAKDQYDNTLLDYTGTITMSTLNETGEITWSLAIGDGTFNDNGAGLDTATYTYTTVDDGIVTFNIKNDTADTNIDVEVSGDGQTDDDTESALAFSSDSIVIDNVDAGYTDVGNWSNKTGGSPYYIGANWRRNNLPTSADYARWTPTIQVTGNYEVSASHRSGNANFASNAPYTTYYDGGSYTYYLDMETGGGWEVMGTFKFIAGTSGYVQLDDNADDDIGADAVRWVLKGSASASANAVTTSSVTSGETDVLIMDVIVSNNTTTTDTITSVTVNNNGTATDAEISSVKLYYDSDNSGDYTTGVDTQAGSGTFASGSKVFSGLNISLPVSGSEYLFVVLDIATTINDGDTLDVLIPANGLVLTNAPEIEPTALNSAGTRDILLNLDHFVISHDNAATAGVSDNVIVTAYDEYDNTKTSYTATITLDTNGTADKITWALSSGSGIFNDGGASVDTATYTFDATDNGTATFTIADDMAETINISVSGDTKSDDNTEGDLVVSAGILDHFVIAHDNAATAGIADNVTVTAKDFYNNTIANYTGQITLDTDGTANAITWGLITGFGVFNDDGAGVDTATYTFNSSDNSTATFSITDTATDTLNISVSGDGEIDDDTEGNLVVSADVLDHFVISHDNAAQAGVADNVTVTAKDQYENTLIDYAGQITCDTDGTDTTIEWTLNTGNGVFDDGGVSLDTATYTYNATDDGVAIFTITDTSLENLNIAVTGGGKTDDNTEGTLDVGPGVIEYFAISHDGFALQNQAENIAVTAYDAYNNLKDDYTGEITLDTDGTPDSITWANVDGVGSFNDGGASVDTATYTYVLGDSGSVTLSLTDTTAEIINISVTAGAKTDDDNEGVLEVVAAGFHHFKITHDGQAVNGVAETVTITAKDASDDTVTNYAGTMLLDTTGTASTITWALDTGTGTFNDGGAGVDTADYTFLASDNGVVILTITDTTEESLNISCSGSGKTDDNTEGNIVVNPAGLNHFKITHDNNAQAGVAENIIIEAQDANDAKVTGYTGTVTLDTDGTAGTITWANVDGGGSLIDGGAAVDTATYAFVSGDAGDVTVTINNTKAETFNISVTAGAKTDDDSEGDLVVIPNSIDHFLIEHDQAAEAGTAEDITITAQDAYDNTITNYTSQITVDTDGTADSITWAVTTGVGSFAEGGSSVDTATYTYDENDDGVVVLNITDIVVESINISVTGDGKTDDNTEGNLVVGAGAIDKFVVGHDNAATAGIAESVTVTAYDIYSNIKTNYTGSITIDTNGTVNAITWAKVTGDGLFNDGGASVDTATYGFVGTDNGTATFTINDTSAETIDIDVSGSGKFDDDSEGNLDVAPSGLDHFSIYHDGNATAGVAEDIIIDARDYYDNVQDDYTGQITVDTNGTDTTITWANVDGNGDFIDGGASVDTATYTYAAGDNGSVTVSINDTKTEVINIAVSGSSKFDDNAEGDITINPNILDYFVILHDNEAIQSVGEEITVTVKDAYGNTKDDYTGEITLDTNGDANNIAWVLNTGSGSFNDGGAGVDTATYTYVLGDAGVASFDLTDDTAETINISVADGSFVDQNNEGDLVVQASSVTVNLSANALTSSYVGEGATGQLILDFTVTNNNVQASDTIDSVTVNNAGTIADNQINSITLYYDSNNSSSYNAGTDNQVGTGTFSSGSVTFSNVDVEVASAGTEELYVVVDLETTVTNGVTVDASVPINGITLTSSPDTDDAVINSSGNLTVDSGAPGNISGLSSTSHSSAISAWNDPQSKDNTVGVNWAPATDSNSGVDGYSILWDTSPTTIPDTTKDIEEGTTTDTSAALSDGTAHYFHIRTVDNVGNWASTAEHIGPFYIDTQSPTSTSIYQITELAGNDYLYVSGNTVYYSGNAYSAFTVYVAAADTGAGLKQAQFPTTVSTGGIDTTEDVGAYQYIYTYTVSSAGSSYNNANVVVYDQAGNSTNVPFNIVLDSTAPSLVTNLSSSSHSIGVSSSDNDITLNWSDVSDSESGLAGYSILVDSSASTLPPTYRNVASGVQTYTANDLMSGNHYAHIRPVDRVGNWAASATHAGAYIIGRGALTSTITAGSIVSTDQDFTVTMNVENTGSSTVNSVDPTTLTTSTTSGASATTSSDPTSQDIGASQNTDFEWTYTAGSIAGTINFTGYAQGSDSEGSIMSDSVTSADVTIEEKAALSVGISMTPTTVNTNETITITVTVINSGQADALNVAPSLTPSGTASPTIASGPTPTSITVGGGDSEQFTYTAYGTAAGTATFTANIASGTDENSNDTLTATDAQDSATVEAPPSYELTSSISASPTAANVSDTITVTMSVQNTGSDTVNIVAPSSLTVGGTSSDAIYATGPIPANVSSLSAGATQDFVWTYTAGTTLGTVNFGGNATSTEADSTQTSSNDVTIQAEAAALSSSISATPTSLLTNATITITMAVDNTAGAGGATAEDVSPSILTLAGTSGQANLLTGPTPASADIAATGTQDFVWTYRAGTTAGTVNFTGNATGTDSNSDDDVSSTANASNDVTISTLSADWMYPTGTDVVGPVRSIPIAYTGMYDKIYFGSDDNNLYVLDGSTHSLDFSYTTSGQIRGLPYPSTDVKGIDLQDIVYFGTLGRTVYGVWADNSLRFERVLGEELSTTVLYDYVSNIYFGTTANNAYCISAFDGTNVWANPATVGGAIESAPAMIYVPTLDYDEIYFGASDGKVYAFKAADGTGARTFDTGFGTDADIKTAPVIALQIPGNSGSRRLMFFGTGNGRFYCVNTSNLSATTEDTGWTTNPIVLPDKIYSAPWVDVLTGYVYVGCQDGKVYAFSLADGNAKANFPVNVGSPIDSWPLVENGICYVGADDGKFYAIDIASGEIVPGWPYDTGGPIKSGAALQVVYDTETWEVLDIYVLVGSDAGKIYGFKVVQ